VEHGLIKTDARGREFWAYGGDFGETVHDGNFVASGLVAPDRTPHPAMWEFKKLAQPLSLRALSVAEGRFVLANKQDFASLDWLEGRWELRREGEVVDAGTLPALDIPPATSKEVSIFYSDSGLVAEPEVYVFFSFTTRSRTSWCDEGHEVAWEEIRANQSLLPGPSGTGEDASQPRIEQTDECTTLTRGSLSILLPTGSSRLPIDEAPRLTLTYDGKPLLLRGPRLNLFRGTTDNDGVRTREGQEHKPMHLWVSAGLDQLTQIERVQTINDEAVRVGAGSSLEPSLTEVCRYVGTDESSVIVCTQTISFVSSTVARIDAVIEVPESFPTLPRIGMIMETAHGFEHLTWYGRGPHENHIDRKAGAPVGRYSGSVSSQYVQYVMPQENGNKCDVRWFELADGQRTMRFVADPYFEFSTHHFSPEDLFAGRHTTDVEDAWRDETIICIDLRQRGVGTGSCGPQTREPYCISPGKYELGFWIEVR